jgi:hypothetical protein
MQQLNCVCDTLAKKAILTAIISGYHDWPTQILPRKDVALVIWSNKVTGDISTPLRFHASKELVRNYLSTRTRDKWSNERFDEVDWEHHELALKNKADMYKVWRSKQTLGFCGTQVMVGMYSGEASPDKRCPNWGRRETAAHLMLCPDNNRTRLLIENVDEMSKWLDTDSRTDPELAYWIPKYILMRGDKPFLMMGYMSPKLKALAESQDCIGWKNLTKGHISTQFYEIQTFHLAMSSSYLNGLDWTKQFITKILQITHSRWIYQNILLHDKYQGYLHNKKSEEPMKEMESLTDLAPEEVPESSRFLLEINFTELSRYHIEIQKYWSLAINATLVAQNREQARGARAKRIQC